VVAQAVTASRDDRSRALFGLLLGLGEAEVFEAAADVSAGELVLVVALSVLEVVVPPEETPNCEGSKGLTVAPPRTLMNSSTAALRSVSGNICMKGGLETVVSFPKKLPKLNRAYMLRRTPMPKIPSCRRSCAICIYGEGSLNCWTMIAAGWRRAYPVSAGILIIPTRDHNIQRVNRDGDATYDSSEIDDGLAWDFPRLGVRVKLCTRD
jgi:hypothetical protein